MVSFPDYGGVRMGNISPYGGSRGLGNHVNLGAVGMQGGLGAGGGRMQNNFRNVPLLTRGMLIGLDS